MSIDDLGVGGGISSGFAHHPLGSYTGTIEKVLKKEIDVTDRGKLPVWEISIKTNIDKIAQSSIWGFNDQDLNKCRDDKVYKQKVWEQIARTRRTLVDLGVMPEKEAIDAKWGDLVSNFGKLSGKACSVKVEQSKKDPNRVVIYLNAPGTGGEKGQEFSADVATPDLDDIPF